MSRLLAGLCVVIGSGVAAARPAPSADEPTAASEPAAPPEVEPPPLPPPPQPPPPEPPPPPDPYAACKRARHDLRVRAEAMTDSDARGRLLVQMPNCSHFDPEAFAKLMASVPAEVVEPVSYHNTGLAFGVELELAEGGGVGVALPATHMVIGSQGSSTLVGLALDLERVSFGTMTPAATTASIGPALDLTLARSDTGRSELLLDIAASYRIFDQSGAFDHRITGRIGPSFRYWLTPSFAAAIGGNVRYDVLADGAGNSKTAVGVGSALDLVGVF